MKNYVIKNIHGDLKVISPRGFIPEDVLCEAPAEFDPDQDDPKCLGIDVDSGNVSIDIAKRDELRASRAAVKAERIAQRPWNELRSKRNSLLSASDWTQMRDASLSKAKKDQWKEYRQALKDLPENTPDINNVQWPEKPE